MVRLTLRHPLRLLLTVILAAAGLPGEDCVIVNPGVALEAISGEGLKDIFLGRKTTWPDGSLVAVIIPKNGPSHDDLLGRLDKSPEQFLIGWKKLVFTGRGFMPDMIANEEALVALVARTAGAIGFADRAKITAGVKVLTVR
jgi:hypothetical protein